MPLKPTEQWEMGHYGNAGRGTEQSLNGLFEFISVSGAASLVLKA
jgi:hypothetical protein